MKETSPTRVVGKEGLRGTIETIAQTVGGGPSRALIRLERGQTILVPAEALTLQNDGSYYLPVSPADVERTYSLSGTDRDESIVIPVIAEELEVEKHAVATGRVRLTKTVHEREEVVEAPLLQEEVEVERVTINRVLDAPVEVRYEDATMIIPLMEEVLVVEKRLMLREEIRVTKRQTETHETQHVTLRTEEINVEREEL